jgi:hypothetical protein
MSDYTTIIIAPTGIADTDAATKALQDDINKIYADAYNLGLSQKDLDDAIAAMTGNSGSQSIQGLLDIIGVLTIECNGIAGALTIINDTINVISDTTNLMSKAMNSYTNLADHFSTSDTMGDTENTELMTFTSSINVFLSAKITVSQPGKTPVEVDGLLNLLSNGPDANGNAGNYWPGGHSPMTSQTAALITTSINGIEGTFGDAWVDINSGDIGNFTVMMNDIKMWSQPKVYTDSSGNPTGISGAYTQNSEIEEKMNAVDDQLTTTTSTLNNYESEGMTLYQQFQSYEENDIQSLKDVNGTMISNQLA